MRAWPSVGTGFTQRQRGGGVGFAGHDVDRPRAGAVAGPGPVPGSTKARHVGEWEEPSGESRLILQLDHSMGLVSRASFRDDEPVRRHRADRTSPLWRGFAAVAGSIVMKSAKLEVDTELFPFKSRTIKLRSGATIHFIDEGQGPLLLLLHGNPTWSFLYRNIVLGLKDGFRSASRPTIPASVCQSPRRATVSPPRSTPTS